MGQTERSHGVKRWSLVACVSALALLLLLPLAAVAKPKPATTVYRNGYVWTVDNKRPRAQAVAVRGAKIVFVGSNKAAKAFIGKKTKVVNLKGRMMMPGLIDSHQHPIEGGASLIGYNLNGVQRTIPELQAVLQGWLDASHDQEPDGWLDVEGYKGALPRGTNLVKADLDALDTERPIAIRNWDHHSIWVNTRGLEVCEIDADTPTPDGGYIEKDAEGKPTGYFADAAMRLVTDQIPAVDPESPEETAQRTVHALNEVGITGVMDAISNWNLDTWTEEFEQGRLNIRVACAVMLDQEQAASDPDGMIADLNDLRDKYDIPNRLVVSQGKVILDGVPDFPAQNGWMLEPYLEEDEDGNWVPGTNLGNGAPFWEPKLLKDTVVKMNTAGWPVHIHALGDASVRWSLDCFEAAQEAGASKDLRNGICHLEPIKRSDIWRFGQLNVVACVQPQWHQWDTSSFDAAKDYLGEERMNNIYPIRSFEIAGAPISFGSDWPVDPLMPWYGIERAVTRTAEPWYGYDDMGPLNPWESITLKNAIRHYTLGSAYQIAMDTKVGSITKGKFADMIVLKKNIFKIPITEVDQTEVVMTIFNGKVVYKK